MSQEVRISTAALLAVAGLSGEALASDKQLVLYGSSSQQSFTGPEHLFDGHVEVQMAFPSRDNVPYSGAYVTFEPGARTAWHSHPAGQHMIVTKGTALTGTRDGQVIEFHEGEAVWCPDDIDHWHGATPDASMTHFVVTAEKDGQNAVWKEKVTDEQYHAALAATQHNHSHAHYDAISERYQHLTLVAAFAASDDLGSLKVAINQALDHGTTINELKEALVHLYPYGGFPKSLNALGTLMSVVDTRKAEGKTDAVGDEPNELPEDSLTLGTEVQTELVGQPVAGPLFDFAPVANTFLQKHLFGDVFARGILNNQDREMLTVAILASMSGTDPQLRSHINMAMNTGITKQELSVLADYLGHTTTRTVGQRIADAIEATSK